MFGEKRLNLFGQLRIALAGMFDSASQRVVIWDVITHRLLELALQPIDVLKRGRVMANQGLKAAGVFGKLALCVVASLGKPEARVDQPPLRLVFALADPDRTAVAADDLLGAVHLLGAKSLCRFGEKSPLLEGERVTFAEVIEVRADLGQIEFAFDAYV